MTMPSDENVQYNITLEAQKALIVLAELTNKTRSFADQMNYAKNVVKEFAKESGMSFTQAKNTLAGLDKELSGTSASSVVFGAKGQEAWDRVGTASEKASSKVGMSSRVMTIAMGMLIHQGINLVINAFQAMFTMALNGLRELETATYNLVNAERTLSEQGVDITPQGLEKSIADLQKLDPLLSKIQATEAVSRISSLVAPAVGFNAKEIDQLTQSIAVLAVKNKGLGKSFEEVESQVSNAFLSGKVSVGINQLGVKITDQIVKDEALRMGLVKTAEEYDKLTGKMQANVKARAMLSVLSTATSKDIAHLPEFFKTADAQFAIFQARIQDFFTLIGEKFGPVLAQAFSAMATLLEKITQSIEKNPGIIDSLVIGLTVMFQVIAAGIELFFKLGNAIGTATSKLIAFLSKVPLLGSVIKWLTTGLKSIPGSTTDIGDAADTPTGTSDGSSGASKYGARYAEAVADAEQKVTEIMKDAHEKQEDLARDHANKMADLQRDLGRKMADISRSLRDKLQDAQKDYGNKVIDINSDTDEKIAEAKQDSYKKSIEAEQKYQDELKNLREKYLMDLEEALRARDARQILRLMRQYALDKEKAVENRDKEREQAKSETAQKIRDLEEERKEKLAQAAKDLADKIKQAQLAASRERRDARIAHQRALDDARQAYRRQLDEQRLFLQRKLQDLAASISKEYELTAAGRAKINALIGSGGSSTSSANSAQYTSSTPVVSPTWARSGMYGTGGLAEGGTFLATRPATINVAETRPEVITATPLGRPGKDISKVFTNGSVGGASGQIELGLTLSPDLEARIISQTLSETANVVLKINRSK